MRLDLFLKATRLSPRRTVAQKLCDAGLVSINGMPAKSAHAVKPGDEITIKRRDRISKIKVVSLPEQRQTSKKDASDLFELVSEEKLKHSD
jgi:ribosomal 50S subunit-recycling heat shock protein